MGYLPRINIEYLLVIAIFLEREFTNENTNTRMKMIYFCQKDNYKITKRKRFLSILTEPTNFYKIHLYINIHLQLTFLNTIFIISPRHFESSYISCNKVILEVLHIA